MHKCRQILRHNNAPYTLLEFLYIPPHRLRGMLFKALSMVAKTQKKRNDIPVVHITTEAVRSDTLLVQPDTLPGCSGLLAGEQYNSKVSLFVS